MPGPGARRGGPLAPGPHADPEDRYRPQGWARASSNYGDSGSASGEVAARLGRGVSSFGPARASLISKGLIYAPEHGVVAFTVPGMAGFIQRQPAPDG